MTDLSAIEEAPRAEPDRRLRRWLGGVFVGRRRLGLLGLCTAYRFAMGLAFATPFAITVAAGATGEHPRSDAALWQPGGYFLLETLRVIANGVAPPVAGGAVTIFALSFGWLLLLAALIGHLGDAELDAVDLLLRALDRFAPLTVLYGLTLVGQAIAVGGAAWLAARFATPDPGGDQLRIAMLAAGLGLAALMAVGHDAARVVCVQERPGVFGLINRTFELLRHRPLALLGAAVGRGALAWIALLAGLGAATHLIAGGAVHLAGTVILQLTAIATYVGLRASWLAWLTRARRVQS